MDGATTAPDVIAGEASASVERPLARVPLVLNRRNFSWITERISGSVEGAAPRWWWVTFAITSMVAMFGLFCLGYQISTGVGVWGLNHPVGWAWDITNFVFWIGIGHAGTLISAILYLLRQKWRTSINRSAEAMTLFAVICAAIFPTWHTTIFPPYFVAGAIFGGFAMVLTLLVPARAIYKLQDIITIQHIDKMAKVILLTGSFVSYAYGMEFFVAWYSGNQYEKYEIFNRIFGPYWWYWWVGMLFCNMLSPQLFWFRRFRQNIYVVYFVCMCVNAGMWFERFIIIVGGLHRDFLPSSWGLFIPTWVDIWTFVGTFGIFLSLFLIFIRYLPMIAMSEVKIVLPEANPHHASPEEHHPVAAGGRERTE